MPGYLTLLDLGNFIQGIGGTERSISEPFATYPIWLAEIMKNEQILLNSETISSSHPLMFAKSGSFIRALTVSYVLVHTYIR